MASSDSEAMARADSETCPPPITLNLLVALLLIAGAAGCIDRFETPSLYDSESLACEGPLSADFNERLEECWSPERNSCEGSFGVSKVGCVCAGLISLDGEVDGRPFRFVSELQLALLELIPTGVEDPSAGDDSQAELLRWLALDGQGPYFDYGFRIHYLPGLWHERPIETTRRFPLPFDDPGTGHRLKFQVDRLEALGESLVPDLGQAEGSIEFRLESADEYRASFSLSAPRARIAGCFATRIWIVR